jgi:hypothetical protein
MKEAAEKALEAKFKEFFLAQMAEQQQSGLLWINLSQEVGQQQMVTMMPLLVLAQANTTCALSSVASTTSQPYLVDCISVSTTCLLLYPAGRVGKMKEVAKAQVDPVGGSFEGNSDPAPICLRTSATSPQIKLWGS